MTSLLLLAPTAGSARAATTTRMAAQIVPQQATSRRTVLRTYSPFSAHKGTPGVRITERAKGYCWTASTVNDDPYAWRCFKGNLIYDPCFSSPSRPRLGYVVCRAFPPGVETAGENAIELILTRPLPSKVANRPASLEKRARWVLRLADGARCVATGSALKVVGSVSLSYNCSTGLAGGLDTAVQPWTVRFLAKGSSRLAVEPVTAALG